MNNQRSFTFKITCFLLIIFNSLYSQESQFTNGIDDDSDGFIDCGDTDSYGQAVCKDAFVCNNTLYQVISKSLNRLDALTGTYEVIGSASSSFNGAGYNVQDGYIYGHKSSSAGVHLWRINNQGSEKDMGIISNFAGRTYVGDFDEDGNLYTYINGNKPSLSFVDVDAPALVSNVRSLSNLHSSSIPGVADITYNPVHKKFYGLSGGLDLIELDPVALTADVIADFTGQFNLSGAFGAGWSDVIGNSYFANNATGQILQVTFDDSGRPSSVKHVATGQPTNSNDGMGCFLSLPPFETNCSDGIDNDGDGLIDCEDPDCANESTCPFVTAAISGSPSTGPNGITPIHITLVNNSKANTDNFGLQLTLPEGFIYLSDTLELLGSSDFDNTVQPVEYDRNMLKWSNFNIPIGDTLVISIGLLVDNFIEEGQYQFSAQVTGVIMKPYVLNHEIEVIESLLYDAEPLSCEPAFYQVYKKAGEPNIFGKLDVLASEYRQIAVINAQLNGLGFDQNTSYAYGSNGKRFIRLDQQGNETYLELDFDKNVYVGDVDDNSNWFGKVGSDIVKVDINTAKVAATYSGQGLPGWDMAFNADGHFYASHLDMLYRFNTTTQQKETIGKLIGATIPLSGHGAQWTGKDGYHYISNNASGRIYRINVNTLEATFVMQATPGLQFNDGFSCPTEIPSVFSYDYGDYNLFPIAIQWAYAQDVDADNLPDYNMVWIGSKVKADLINPYNETASGEADDDVLGIEGELISNNEVDLSFDLNTNMTSANAYWGLWIDWDEDGQYDVFYQGKEAISERTTIVQKISLPETLLSNIGIRIRASTTEIKESMFVGEVTEPGEIEDHLISVGAKEICGNNIDDDNDGLTDCDDPDCIESCDYDESSSSQDGGLESNRRLSQKIAETTYRKIRNGNSKDYLMRANLSTFSKGEINYARTGSYSIEDFIPLDVIEGTQSYVNTPEHLQELTNATELFSIDIFNESKRVAAVLALETEQNVYEHSKYICDRLSGARIVDILKYQIGNGKEFIAAKIENASGNIEYASSFSFFENENGQFTLESHWNLESYSDFQNFYNFQIWSNNTLHLIQLMDEIVRLMEFVHPIEIYNIGSAPELFVESGKIEDNQLSLNIINRAGIKYVETIGTMSLTETSLPESYSSTVLLSGSEYEEINIDVGTLYDLGLTFYHPELSTSDVIFLADGSWGAQAGTPQDLISKYEILTSDQFDEYNYEVKRNVQISGFVKNYINIYRSLNARFSAEDLDDYLSFNFKASGNATIEVSILRESIADWSLQAKQQIHLTEEHTEYSLGKEFFKSIYSEGNSWDDAYLIVFNLLGDQVNSEPFKLHLSDVYFGKPESETPYIIYTDSNYLQESSSGHSANILDGTLLENVEITSASPDKEIVVYVQNTGVEEVLIDELDILNNSRDFSILNFEPTLLGSGEVKPITIIYSPMDYPSTNQAEYILYIKSNKGYFSHKLNVSANSICTLKDHISSVEANGTKEFSVVETISSDATIKSGSVIFTAGDKILLQAGFSIESGAELKLINENRCEN